MTDAPYYCKEHDRVFTTSQGLSLHRTRTHKNEDLDDNGLSRNLSTEMAKLRCKHKDCVPHYVGNERGLRVHNAYVRSKALMEGQPEPTEEPQPLAAEALFDVPTVEGVLPLPAEAAYGTPPPGVLIAARGGKAYSWDGDRWVEWSEEELIKTIRMAIRLS